MNLFHFIRNAATYDELEQLREGREQDQATIATLRDELAWARRDTKSLFEKAHFFIIQENGRLKSNNQELRLSLQLAETILTGLCSGHTVRQADLQQAVSSLGQLMKPDEDGSLKHAMHAALEDIIAMERRTALDQYGGAEKAEAWSVVQVARQAIKKAKGE